MLNQPIPARICSCYSHIFYQCKVHSVADSVWLSTWPQKRRPRKSGGNIERSPQEEMLNEIRRVRTEQFEAKTRVPTELGDCFSPRLQMCRKGRILSRSAKRGEMLRGSRARIKLVLWRVNAAETNTRTLPAPRDSTFPLERRHPCHGLATLLVTPHLRCHFYLSARALILEEILGRTT